MEATQPSTEEAQAGGTCKQCLVCAFLGLAITVATVAGAAWLIWGR